MSTLTHRTHRSDSVTTEETITSPLAISQSSSSAAAIVQSLIPHAYQGAMKRNRSLMDVDEESLPDEDRPYSSPSSSPANTSVDAASHLDDDVDVGIDLASISLLTREEESSSLDHPSHEQEVTDASSSPLLSPRLLATILAWVSLGMAVFAGSTIGPAFRYLMTHGIPPCLAASWRCQVMTLIMVPIGIIESFWKPENRVEWMAFKPGLPNRVIVSIFISGISWSANLLLWIVALQYISTFRASIVTASHPVMLVVILYFRGTWITKFEWLGVFVAFSGMIISNSVEGVHGEGSADAHLASMPLHWQTIGFILCVLSAMAEVMVIFNRIETRKHVPLMQYTASTTIIVAFSATIVSVILEGSDLWARDASGSISGICYESHCVLGWLAPFWRWKIFLFGLWIGAVCITGMNYAMEYVPPLIFSSVSLLDPSLTALISYTIGVESLPQLSSWLGGLIVILGLSSIMVGEHQREHSADPRATTNQMASTDASVIEDTKFVALAQDEDALETEV